MYWSEVICEILLVGRFFGQISENVGPVWSPLILSPILVDLHLKWQIMLLYHE